MAGLGRYGGPRQSIIIERLGHEYFGITAGALYDDYVAECYGECRGVVVPVHVDEVGYVYVIFSKPSGGSQRYYLADDEAALLGDTFETYILQECRMWQSARKEQELQQAAKRTV